MKDKNHIKEPLRIRLQIEKALQKSQEIFRGIFNNARDGILLADIETKKFIHGNAKICQMLGYGIDELMTIGVKDIHPAENLPEVFERFEQLVRQEVPLVADIPVKRKDGSLFIADINSFLLEMSGRTYIVGLFRDVTERKREEEERRRILAELEHRVRERTEDLQLAVAQLQEEVTERQRAEEALKESEAKLRDLARQLLFLQEEERRALSLDLQESLAHSIAVLKMDLRTFEQKLPARNKALRDEYRQTLKQIDVIVENLRRRAAELSPQILTDLGLTVGLKSLCESYGIESHFYLDDLSECFSLDDQFSIYRVFQEALNNVSRHSKASLVTLSAKKQDDLVEFLVEILGSLRVGAFLSPDSGGVYRLCRCSGNYQTGMGWEKQGGQIASSDLYFLKKFNSKIRGFLGLSWIFDQLRWSRVRKSSVDR
jgi:PAS domain S-box-containing protein